MKNARKALVLAIYAALWGAADLASTRYAHGTGLSVWDVRAALDVLLFFYLGWGWWPLPVALSAIRIALAPQGLHEGFAANVLASIPYELVYALATKFAVETLDLAFPLVRLRDVGLFVVSLCGAAPLVANAVLLLVFRFTGPWKLDFFQQLAQGAIADASSIVVIVPVATVLVAWKTLAPRDQRSAGALAERRLGLQALVTAVVVVLEYAMGTRSGRPLVEFSFLPLAWMSITGGVRGAAVAILVCDIATTAMHLALNVPIASQIEYQGYFIASALMSLILGSISIERQDLLERLKRAAYYDPATELPNGPLMNQLIDEMRGESLVLLLLEVADIRLLNEAVGRISSDRILANFAGRLRDGLSDDHVIARMNAYEFAIAVRGATDPAPTVDRVRELAAQPFAIQDANVYIEALIGAVATPAISSAFDAFRQADIALRRAIDNVARATTYTPELEQNEEPLPVVEIHRAVERGELVPFFQPIFRFDEPAQRWRLTGAEALLRWRHPERGLLMPAQFLSLLEHFSIGPRVGWDVLNQSLQSATRFRQTFPDFQVWVNFFPRQVLDQNCVALIRRAIERNGSQPEALVVEIPELIVARNDEVAKVARELTALGVTIAIDDFGTGGSSLSRLREVPAQLLKIDRSFVSRVDVDEKARTVSRAVARLARDLGIDVLAEGVENPEQIEIMLEAGCGLAQGYALGHPVPLETFEATFLAQENAS